MSRLRDGHRDDQMPYGVDTIRLRISFPAAPVSRGYNGRAWKMRPLRGWTGGQAADSEPSAGAEQGGVDAPNGIGWGGAGGGTASTVADRAFNTGTGLDPAGNPNVKVDRLWAERAAVTTEMAQLDASGDYGRSAAELYQQLENRRDIIDTNIRSQLSSDLSAGGVQEPGDLEAYLREQAEQAGAQPGAYDRMSAEEQRLFIKAHAPDYEAARSAEAAQRLGEAMGGPLGEAWGQLGMGLATGAGVLGSRAFRRGARAGAGRSGGVPAEVGSGGAPALKGDPYHPESVELRVKPPYEANLAHKPGPNYDFNKTPEPLDAQSVYKRSLLGRVGTWYGQSSSGEYYRFHFDRSGSVHFAGTVSQEEIPPMTLKALKQAGP